MTVIDLEPPPIDHEPTPTRPKPTSPRPPRRRLWDDLPAPLSRSWGVALVAAWVVVVAVGLAVEPAPANPDAAPPLVAELLSTAMMVAWGALAVGVVQGRRLAAVASLGGAVMLTALTLGCPLSGHHGGVGAWFAIQLAGAFALVVLSARALR